MVIYSHMGIPGLAGWLLTSLRVVAFSAFLTLATAGAAWAHAQIRPAEVPAGATEEFTLEVVHEKDMPTTEVRMEVPEGFALSSVRSPSGWQGIVEDDDAVIWSGARVSPGQDMKEFGFEARAPEEAGDFAFEVVQTYADGNVVEWTGAENSNEPAAFVTVTMVGLQGDAAGSDEHGEHRHTGEGTSDTGTIEPTLLLLGIIATGALALGAAFIARLRRS
jgi:uncharacterized protein YcnI